MKFEPIKPAPPVTNILKISNEYYLKLDDSKKKNFRFLHVSTDEVFGDLKLNEENYFSGWFGYTNIRGVSGKTKTNDRDRRYANNMAYYEDLLTLWY